VMSSLERYSIETSIPHRPDGGGSKEGARKGKNGWGGGQKAKEGRAHFRGILLRKESVL